ncbi:MAG: 4Fe-4S binding protein [Actinomycetia bacterium]|nr:4Fe-4S binding protein [Actinomycetes bacterium]
MAKAKWDVSNFDNWKTADFPIGMVGLEAGNSRDYITGGWRSERPVWNKEKCQHCMMCWVICPDAAIQVKNEKMVGIDFNHCKGCGICIGECRFGALKMVPEHSEEV